MEVASFFASLGLRVNEKQWATGDRVISGVKKAVGAFLAVKTVQAVGNVISEITDLGGHLADASQKTGVASQTLQEYGYAAGLAGSSLDDVIGALGKLNKGLGEAAATGKGPAADGLHALGISMQDPAVKAGNLDGVLLSIADKFAKLPDGPKKVKAAMDLFGKSGADLIPMLNAGADGLKVLKKEANDLGIVLDQDMVKSFDQFGDDVDRAKGAWQGFKTQAVAAILPIIQALLPKLIEGAKMLSAWVHENRAEILAWGKGFATILKVIAKTIVVVVKGVVQAIRFVVDKIINIGSTLRSIWEGIKSFFIGIGNGIKAFFVAIIDWVANKVQDLVDTAQAAAAKIARALGKNVVTDKQLRDNDKEVKDLEADPNSALNRARRVQKGIEDAAAARKTSSASVPSTNKMAAAAGPIAIRGGDIHIEINSATGDPVAINDAVQKTVSDHMDNWLMQTHEVVG